LTTARQQRAQALKRAAVARSRSLETSQVKLNSTAFSRSPLAVCAVAALAALAGCSSVESFLSGDKIDYRSQSSKVAALDVPPDLTQLARDSRYQPQAAVVSASDLQQQPAAGAAAVPAAGASAPALVALNTATDMRIERDGNQRWLFTTMTPEQLWPQIRAFWTERGFNLVLDDAQAGVMETDWAENRAKIPQDGIRRLIGGLFDSLYSTGERDRFRTRVERVAGGTEVAITHRGVEEVLQGQTRENTTWTNRPSDPQLEAEMLVRLMVKLGIKEDTARTQVVNAPVVAARARVLGGQPGAALEFDESFDRAWRRIGLALDRTGFTVEDRDRSGGLYFVRYVDPKYANREEPNFFSKLFGGNKDQANLQRYRIALKAAGDKTQVAVLTAQGTPEGGETGQRIVSLLVDELK
jgi:outer membrane protein assembly factor BamC